MAKQRIIDEEQLLSAALQLHDPARLKAVREEMAALPRFDGEAAEGHIVEVISEDEMVLPFKGRRGVIGSIRTGNRRCKVTFPDGTETGWLEAQQIQSSGLDQGGYDEHLESAKQRRLSLLRAACDTLPTDLSDALASVRKRVAQDRLPLLSLVQALPLQMQSSHLSFQEFYAARAICSGTALSGQPPWQWEAWWGNALRLGREMGEMFGKGLLCAAGVEGDSLDLSRQVGGDHATSCQAIVTMLADSASLATINLSYNALGSESAKALAPVIRDSASLTSVNLLRNGLDTEAASVLLKVKDFAPRYTGERWSECCKTC